MYTVTAMSTAPPLHCERLEPQQNSDNFSPWSTRTFGATTGGIGRINTTGVAGGTISRNDKRHPWSASQDLSSSRGANSETHVLPLPQWKRGEAGTELAGTVADNGGRRGYGDVQRSTVGGRSCGNSVTYGGSAERVVDDAASDFELHNIYDDDVHDRPTSETERIEHESRETGGGDIVSQNVGQRIGVQDEQENKGECYAHEEAAATTQDCRIEGAESKAKHTSHGESWSMPLSDNPGSCEELRHTRGRDRPLAVENPVALPAPGEARLKDTTIGALTAGDGEGECFLTDDGSTDEGDRSRPQSTLAGGKQGTSSSLSRLQNEFRNIVPDADIAKASSWRRHSSGAPVSHVGRREAVRGRCGQRENALQHVPPTGGDGCEDISVEGRSPVRVRFVFLSSAK